MKEYCEWISPGVECWVWINNQDGINNINHNNQQNGEYHQCRIEKVEREKGLVQVKIAQKDDQNSNQEQLQQQYNQIVECKIDKLMERELNSEHNYYGYVDMVHMKYLNEAEILNNLKKRYHQNSIFTYIGPTLIVINPYKDIDNGQGNEVIEQIKIELGISIDDRSQQFNKLPNSQSTITQSQAINNKISPRPHTYTISGQAYKQMFQNKRQQAIIISGESGAGKTENAKLSMQFLTSLSSGQQEDMLSQLRAHTATNVMMEDLNQFPIEVKILACNPILEAFGNAKTVRNNNSSRFGKYVKIYIDKISHKIQGASIDNYLLEKSRIPSPAKGERNYHIFYHMLKGNQELSQLRLSQYKSPAEFEYLRKSECYSVETIQDSKLYLEVKKSFRQMNVNAQEQDAIFSLLSATLLLGNANLDSSKSSDSQASTFLNFNLPTHFKEFKNACELLQVNAKNLEEALVFKIRKVGMTVIKSPQSPEECISMRDSLSKILYDSLFNFLVWKMNQSLLPPQDLMNKCLSIGLLDIFGFESFDLNSFEQLCINFTNEKFQQLYVQYVFKSEEDDYKQEGIQDVFANLQYQENQFIIDTIEKKPNGIMILLDESCSLGSGTDESFLNQIVKNHSKNSIISFPKKEKNSFSLCHTAKQVVYSVQGFRDKNKDEVSSEVEKCLSMSTCPTIASLLSFQQGDKIQQQQQPSSSPSNFQMNNAQNSIKKQVKFLGQKFRQSLQELMIELNSSDAHFIRCLKPNEEKRKNYFKYDYVYQQVQYLGLLDSIKIRKFGYSYRMTYEHFFLEYQELGQKTKGLTLQQISQQKLILKDLIQNDIFEKTELLKNTKDLPDKPVAFGKNKIFLKNEVMKKLHEKIQEIIQIRKSYAKKIIHAMKKYLFKKYFHINLFKIKQKLIKMQSFARMLIQRRRFLNKKKAIIKMKKIIRIRQLEFCISAFRLNLIQYVWDMVSFMIFSKTNLQQAFQAIKYCQRTPKNQNQINNIKTTPVIITTTSDKPKTSIPNQIENNQNKKIEITKNENQLTVNNKQVSSGSSEIASIINEVNSSDFHSQMNNQSQFRNSRNVIPTVNFNPQSQQMIKNYSFQFINKTQHKQVFFQCKTNNKTNLIIRDKNNSRKSNAWRQTLVANPRLTATANTVLTDISHANHNSTQQQIDNSNVSNNNSNTNESKINKNNVNPSSLLLKFTEYNPAYQYSEMNMEQDIHLEDVPSSEDTLGELDDIIDQDIIKEIKKCDFFLNLSTYLAKRTKWGIKQSQEKIMQHQMKPISNPLTNIKDLKNIISYEDTKEAIKVIRSIVQQNSLAHCDSTPTKRIVNFEDAQTTKTYKLQISTPTPLTASTSTLSSATSNSAFQTTFSKVSLMNPRKASVRDVNSLNLIIQKQKTLTKAIKNKKYTPSEKAVNIFKTILKCVGERKSRYNRHTNIIKLLTLCNEESIDMKEEVYLQFCKQLCSNSKRESRIKYLKLFAIIASVMPTTSRFFYPLLNFLYSRSKLVSQIDKEEKIWYQYCFLRLHRSEQIQRSCIPTDTEIVMIENKKQILIRVYLLNEVPITIGVESYTSVKMLKQELLKRIGVNDRHDSYGLMEVRNNIKSRRRESRFIDENERVMDVISFWEAEQNLFSSHIASSHHNSRTQYDEDISDDIHDFNVQNYQELDGLKIYLSIRVFFAFEERDKEAISIFYCQAYSEVQGNKFTPLEEIDYLNLAALQLCIDYPRPYLLKQLKNLHLEQQLNSNNSNQINEQIIDEQENDDEDEENNNKNNSNNKQKNNENTQFDETDEDAYERFVQNNNDLNFQCNNEYDYYQQNSLYLDISFYIPQKIYSSRDNNEWKELILQKISNNKLLKKQFSPFQAKLAYILYLSKQDFFMSTIFREVKYQRIKLQTLNDTLSSKEKYEQMMQTEQLTPIKDDILLAINPSNILMCDPIGLQRPKRRVQIRNIQKFCCTDKEVILVTHDNSKHIFETIPHCREITFLIRSYLRAYYDKQQKSYQQQQQGQDQS